MVGRDKPSGAGQRVGGMRVLCDPPVPHGIPLLVAFNLRVRFVHLKQSPSRWPFDDVGQGLFQTGV